MSVRAGSRSLLVLGAALVVLGVGLTVCWHPRPAALDHAAQVSAERGSGRPAVRHVFVINIENKGFGETWGPYSRAPYLARTLRGQGVLLRQYFGIGHHSLPNYLAQVSGQGPDAATQGDCPTYAPFHSTGATRSPQQSVGYGCVYPSSVR